MAAINRKIIAFSLILFHSAQFLSLYSQDSFDDPSYETGSEEVESPQEPEDIQGNEYDVEPESSTDVESGYNGGSYSGAAVEEQAAPYGATSLGGTDEGGFQNAIIEGVQLTAEPGTVPDEKIVAGYFIFRDKPSSYFYEVKLREKKLIFEFNDTRVGSSPVPTVSEAPVKGFTIEQGKIDVNKAVKGLKPEWHDLIRVVFDLEAVPDVHVNDEYSIVSFSFKWTSDPSKQNKYIVKDQTPKVILFSSVGVGGVALGAVAYLLLRPKETEQPLTKLSIDDLPVHKN